MGFFHVWMDPLESIGFCIGSVVGIRGMRRWHLVFRTDTIEGMRTTYILGAILACSVTGTLAGARSTKTALLVVAGILSLYGLARLLG